jgi:hypothetical protein
VVADKGQTIFFSGYARLPSGFTATEYKVIGVFVVIDMETKEILDADSTLATQLGREFVKKILVGYSMDKGIETLLRTIDVRYQGSAQKAINTALKVINDKYRKAQKGLPCQCAELG